VSEVWTPGLKVVWQRIVWEWSGLEPMAKLLGLGVSVPMNKQGRAFESIMTMARKANVDRRTLQRHSGELVEAGLLRISERPGYPHQLDALVPPNAGDVLRAAGFPDVAAQAEVLLEAQRNQDRQLPLMNAVGGCGAESQVPGEGAADSRGGAAQSRRGCGTVPHEVVLEVDLEEENLAAKAAREIITECMCCHELRACTDNGYYLLCGECRKAA
jgi:hypothetical protein